MPKIYNQKQIEILKTGGKKLAVIVEKVKREIEEGVSAKEIDRLAHNLIKKAGGSPSFLNHQGYPASTCISVNEEVVHSVPKNYKFRNGDIVGLDAGMNFKGLHTDIAATVPVGRIKAKVADFIKTARKALELGIAAAKPGKTTGDIGEAIQSFVEARGYSVVRELSGHGVGLNLHEEPTIPNLGIKGEGEILREGMVIAIEPIINMGGREIETEIDGWRVSTKDKSLSAHFEHTVLITKAGSEILTKP